VRERVLHRAQRQPGDVVHRVAEVRELPVDDRGDPPVLVHEVAGAGVALNEHDRHVAVRHVALEPVEAQPHQRVERPFRPGRAPAHVRDLVQCVLPGRLHGAEARQRELARVEAMERGEVPDEVLRDAHLLVGVADPVEPRVAADPLGEHRLFGGVYGERARHGHVGVLEREEHLGLDVQRVEDAAHRLRRAAVAEEQRERVPGTVDVDEPGFAARATGNAVGAGDAAGRLVLDPLEDRFGQRQRGVAHP
jgi:hypothetical protein